MRLTLPDMNKTISRILKVESNFVLEKIHPSLGHVEKRQTIEDRRKSYLRQIS